MIIINRLMKETFWWANKNLAGTKLTSTGVNRLITADVISLKNELDVKAL